MRISKTCFAVLLLAATAACSGAPAPTSTSSSSPAPSPSGALAAAPSPHLVRAIRADEESVVSVETSHPWASCKLDAADLTRAPAGTAAADALTVYADDEGVVRFRAHPTDPRATTAPMRLDCADEAGVAFSVAVDLVVDAAAPHATAMPAAKGRVRPALAEDPMRLSPEELVARGFPPRPDPLREPSHYAAWLEMASHPVTVVEPHLVRSERVHGPRKGTYVARERPVAEPSAPATAVDHSFLEGPNWAGMVIHEPGVQYQWIMGSWNVPSTWSEGGFWSTTYTSEWVGMDGQTTQDIAQAGTEQDTSSRFWVASSANYAWTEYYPLDTVVVSNFPVNPGDVIDTWVWITDANGYYNVNGGYAAFMLYNATQYVLSNAGRTAIAPGLQYTGNSAEWIEERPTVGGSLPDLTHFAPTTMSQAYARDANGNQHDFNTDDSLDEIWMVNGNDLLAACFPGQPETMTFYWYNYN